MDTTDGKWHDDSGQLTNDWMESQLQQYHINAERQKGELSEKMAPENQSSWMSEGQNDDKSTKQLLMQLLHQQSGQHNQSAQAFDHSERTPSPGFYAGANSTSVDPLVTVLQECDSGLNNSLRVGSYGSNSSELPQFFVGSENAGVLEKKRDLRFKSSAGAFVEREQILPGMPDSNVGIHTNPTVRALADHDLARKSSARHASVGVAGEDVGFYDEGIKSQHTGQIKKIQVPVILSKSQDNTFVRYQEGLPDLASDPLMRLRNSFSGVLDGIKPEEGGIILGSGELHPIAMRRLRKPHLRTCSRVAKRCHPPLRMASPSQGWFIRSCHPTLHRPDGVGRKKGRRGSKSTLLCWPSR
ncbi:hypothetical protein MLD38_017068 [Melastoma candidum]|uniref:Uncharacterized protein n=1 Tax=Melastoma candidum TaxID=119954 RepID=A0ACB9QPL8_9MYRT|nr:hypothetical protein MLD38_017068 [Melastoma candidum]